MTRTTRTVIVLSIATATAAAGSLAVYAGVKSLPAANAEVARTYVVVAARPLPLGTAVREADLRLIAWPAASPLSGSFTKIDAVAGRGLIASVAANEPITETKLAAREAGAGLPPSIEPGMRAMSVKVNEVIGVAGFVVPGTRVDLLVTVRNGTDSVARTVVSNAQVLTAGTRYDQEKAKKGEPIPSTVVTLMVTPQDAERIALAQSQGDIMLSLRNPMDVRTDVETSGARMAGLISGPPAPVKPAAAVKAVAPRPALVAAVAPPPAATAYTVEVIRAATRKEETIR